MIFLYILLAIAVLLFMVLIHEFGHYIVGRILKFKITEFSIGFGPAIFSRTNKRGEKISLRAFPLGGYCAFFGEENEEDEKSDEAFCKQKPWKRILVFFAGVFANFLTAIIFSWILLCTMGYDVMQVKEISALPVYGTETVYDEDGDLTSATYVIPEENTLKSGDVILAIDGIKVDFAFGSTFSTLVSAEQTKAQDFYAENGLLGLNEEENYLYQDAEGNDYDFSNAEIRETNFYSTTFTIKRDGHKQDVLVYFLPQTVTTNGTTTVSFLVGFNYNSYKYGFFEGLGRSFSVAFGFGWVVLKSLWQLITFQLPISQVGGPITTIATMAQVTSASLKNLLVLIPLLSANLAVFNILPIPSLDGAHVVFTIIEWIRKKPIKREVEAKIHFVGICVLMAFVVIVDILHFVL